jgi:hypothetical protein
VSKFNAVSRMSRMSYRFPSNPIGTPGTLITTLHRFLFARRIIDPAWEQLNQAA